MREDEVHFAVRQFLQRDGWLLVAGQYPNASDDDLPILDVKNPSVACDNSPDPRRHARDKLVPDLIALKNNVGLVVEMKPGYDINDELKLLNLLSLRRSDFLRALRDLSARTEGLRTIDWEQVNFVPALGFSEQGSSALHSSFAFLHVENLDNVRLTFPN